MQSGVSCKRRHRSSLERWRCNACKAGAASQIWQWHLAAASSWLSASQAPLSLVVLSCAPIVPSTWYMLPIGRYSTCGPSSCQICPFWPVTANGPHAGGWCFSGSTLRGTIDGWILASVARRSQPSQIFSFFCAPNYYLYRVRGTPNSVPGNARHNDRSNGLFVDKTTIDLQGHVHTV